VQDIVTHGGEPNERETMGPGSRHGDSQMQHEVLVTVLLGLAIAIYLAIGM
jgi:hypothetical protein